MRTVGISGMRTGLRALCGLLMVTIVFGIADGAAAADGDTPEETDRCLLGWIPYWDHDRAMASFRSNVELFNTVSFFWYYLDEDGEIQRYSKARQDTGAIEFARSHGVKTLAIVANTPDDSAPIWQELTARALGQLLPKRITTLWDEKRVARVLESPEARTRHVADLVALAEENGFDGINIDYEDLEREQREDFTLFIQELSEALHARNKLLAVGIHPKTSEDDPRESNGSEAQDWEAIHPLVDQMHFITYGEFVPTEKEGPAGPIASPDWVRAVLDYAVNVRGVPREKAYMGMPLYAESYHQKDELRFVGEGLELTYDDVVTLERAFDGLRQWHAESSSPYLRYTDAKGEVRVVWFEDARSVREKLKLRSELGICNVGLWRLGGEDPSVWIELARPPDGADRSTSDAGDDPRVGGDL